MDITSNSSGAVAPGYTSRNRSNVTLQEVENGFIVSTHHHPYKQFVFESAVAAADKVKELLLEPR